MRICLSILILMSLVKMQSQELLMNPSFEDYDSLAHKNGLFNAKHWFIPNNSTVDYYSEDLTKYKSIYAIPNNMFGYHPPYDGKVYIGLALFAWAVCDYELITGTLKEKLRKDSLYQISFHIKYAGDSIWFYSKIIEAYFSKEKYAFEMSSVYSGNFEEVLKPVKATINIEKAYNYRTWVNCNALYKAKGDEKYITLGLIANGYLKSKCTDYQKMWLNNDFVNIEKFINDNQIFPISVNNEFAVTKTKVKKLRDYSYYFIDDVSVKLKTQESIETTYPKTDVPEK